MAAGAGRCWNDRSMRWNQEVHSQSASKMKNDSGKYGGDNFTKFGRSAYASIIYFDCPLLAVKS